MGDWINAAGERAKLSATAFWRDERGATAIEYTLLIGLIFLGIAGAIGSTGEGLMGRMEETTDTAIDAMAGAGG